MRKSFWVEFAAKKLQKLWRPVTTYDQLIRAPYYGLTQLHSLQNAHHTYMLILKKGLWIEMFTQRHRDIIAIIKCAWLERNVWPFVCFSGMPRGKFLLLPYVSVIHSDICSIYLFGFKFFLVLVFEEFWRGDPTPPPFWRECGLCLF